MHLRGAQMTLAAFQEQFSFKFLTIRDLLNNHRVIFMHTNFALTQSLQEFFQGLQSIQEFSFRKKHQLIDTIFLDGYQPNLNFPVRAGQQDTSSLPNFVTVWSI